MSKTIYPYGIGGNLPSSIGLVNDLFTGGADKALSAEMGKVLDGKIEGKGIFLGTLLQKSLTASGLSDTNAEYRVSTASNMVVPVERATLEFHLPAGIGVGIRSGDEAGDLSNNNYWYRDGDTFSFASGVHYFRLCFAKPSAGGAPYTYTAISVAEVESYLAGDGILIRLQAGERADIVERNLETEKYVKAAMRNFVSGASNNGGLNKLPLFGHISDVHGDATRFTHFLDYCDYLGVDAALVSGDVVALTPTDGMQYINDGADEHATPVHLCMGNHDARGLTTAQTQNSQIMGYLITKNGSSTPVGESYPTYYYQDYSAKKVRLIGINLYESSHTSDNCNFTQAQCQWLISTLASTPADYGVLIMLHTPESRPAKDAGHAAFYQEMLNWTGYQTNITGNPFSTIVDAFIGKASTTITYKVGTTTITAAADFTGVATGVEFIAFVTGHLHADQVGYVSGTTYKQLVLDVTCGVAIYGSTYPYLANNSDLPRGCKGATQDAFNIYAIDRDAKQVRIARVGSNRSSYDLTERKCMTITYAD